MSHDPERYARSSPSVNQALRWSPVHQPVESAASRHTPTPRSPTLVRQVSSTSRSLLASSLRMILQLNVLRDVFCEYLSLEEFF